MLMTQKFVFPIMLQVENFVRCSNKLLRLGSICSLDAISAIVRIMIMQPADSCTVIYYFVVFFLGLRNEGLKGMIQFCMVSAAILFWSQIDLIWP